MHADDDAEAQARQEYHEIVAKLIAGGHWEAIVGLWIDLFEKLDGIVYLQQSEDPANRTTRFETFARDVLRDLFSQVTWATSEQAEIEYATFDTGLSQDLAFCAGIARDQIIVKTREYLAASDWSVPDQFRPPLAAAFQESPSVFREWPAALRELLMDIWNDPDGQRFGGHKRSN
jgi:hypothetical protein